MDVGWDLVVGSRGPPGGSFDTSWDGVFGLLFGFLGPPGASWGPLECLLGLVWGLLGPPQGGMAEFSVRGPLLGAVSARFWAVLGASWGLFPRSCEPLRVQWGHSYGGLGGLLISPSSSDGPIGTCLSSTFASLF